MPFAELEIEQITGSIWESLLGLTVECTGEIEASVLPRDRPIMGCVHISGEWNGAVVLQCERTLSEQMTRLMLALGDGTVTREEVLDVVGELTNNVGGNVKALLPGPSTLSLPAVIEGDDYSLRIPGTMPISRLAFKTLGESFFVTLVERDPNAQRFGG